MNRRQYVALLGTAAVAGCTSGGSGGGGGTDTQTQTPTATPTATAAPPEYELVSVEAAERVEIGEDWSFAWTVRNTGGQDGVVTTTVSAREAGGEWQSLDQELELEVPAGETATWQSEASPFSFLGELTYRLDRFDATYTVTIVPKTLAWGRPYTIPDEIQLICNGVEIEDSFEWSASGYDYVEEAPSGSTFGLLSVRAEHVAGTAARAPLASNFYLVQDDQQYNPQIISTYPEQYRGGELQAGIVARGDIVYELPAGTSEADLEAVYSSGTYTGDIAVYWGRDE